jgi:hypothetical protein
MLIYSHKLYAQRIECVDMQVLKDFRGSGAIVNMLRSLDLADFKSTYVSLAIPLNRLRPVNPRLPFNTPVGPTTVLQNS